MANETGNRLIRGGKIVDGTGARPVLGDLRIRDGVIAEIASTIEPSPGEEVFDATAIPR